jgi:hypothetical protein
MPATPPAHEEEVMSAPPSTPLERLLLIDIAAIDRTLAQMARFATQLPDDVAALLPPGALPPVFPTRAQLSRAVARMWRRLVQEPGAFGLSPSPPRRTWRARLLRGRALRLPFLLREGSVVPGDLSGLRSGRDVIIRHLVGTHHDVHRGLAQARYDLEILALHQDGLQTLRRTCQAIVSGTHPRADLYRDLCVYEGYHEGLLALVDEVCAHGFTATDDPDLSFFAMLRACAALPDTAPSVWTVFAEAGLKDAAAAPRRAVVGEGVAP